jgi:DNA repair exonuclease SbcCD nuclease subunit
MITALCIGDVHVHTNNIETIKLFIKKIESILQQDDTIDIVILMGDILHTHERLHTVSFNTATDLFSCVSKLRPTYILVGNHDYINNSQFLSTNHWMNCFKTYNNITIVDKAIRINIKGTDITLCPYVPEGRFVEALNTVDGWKTSKCIFGHQTLNGAKMGAIVAKDVEEWNDEYPMLISGHIHDKQLVKDNLLYTGSCIQHAFGESHDKTILRVNINDTIKYTEIDLGLRKKRIIYIDTDKLSQFELPPESDTEYKITVSGSNEEFSKFKQTQKYKNIIATGIKVLFKHKRGFVDVRKQNLYKAESGKNFRDILSELIETSDDLKNDINRREELRELYNTFVDNKCGESPDILYI